MSSLTLPKQARYQLRYTPYSLYPTRRLRPIGRYLYYNTPILT